MTALKDLPKDERDALSKLRKGGPVTWSIPDDVRDRLKAKGLAEEGFGGLIISREGKRIVDEFILARRAAS